MVIYAMFTAKITTKNEKAAKQRDKACAVESNSKCKVKRYSRKSI